MTTNILGQTVSHYRVIEPLGEGGMGVVYRAEDVKLGRPVALKFLSPGRSQDRQMLERFMREARTASALNHPNICTIYEIDEFEGAPFIAMELLEGHTLDHRIDHRPLGIDQVARLRAPDLRRARCGARARHPAPRHQAGQHLRHGTRPGEGARLRPGQVHRDAHSGSGVLRSDAQTELLTELLSTRAGVALGTIAYMSPEQARGEDLDARSDLFSFGLVLYEMTTGQRTFQGSTSAVIFDAILNREPAAPIELNANVPAALERIIAKLLDKDKEGRYHERDRRAQPICSRSSSNAARDDGQHADPAAHGVAIIAQRCALAVSEERRDRDSAFPPSHQRRGSSGRSLRSHCAGGGIVAVLSGGEPIGGDAGTSRSDHGRTCRRVRLPLQQMRPPAAPQPATPPAPAPAPPAVSPPAAGADSRRAASGTPCAGRDGCGASGWHVTSGTARARKRLAG